MDSMTVTTTTAKPGVFKFSEDEGDSNPLMKLYLRHDVEYKRDPTANASFDIEKHERLQLTVDQYRFFKQHGWIKILGLLSKEELQELNSHLDNVQEGKERIPGLDLDHLLTPEEKRAAFSRIHMLHRRHPLHEKYLLHPRVLDVLEQLVSPDILALQTICFFKEPGQSGQGYHQDLFYIPTLPNTLTGSWIALTPAIEENGCLRFADGSHAEPIYYHPELETTFQNKGFKGIFPAPNASSLDPDVNELTPVGQRYEEAVGTADAGDAFFFVENLLHYSEANVSKTQTRRTFTTHYCDARSLVKWSDGEDIEGENGSNARQILAQGDTHLPYGKPKFGMPVKIARHD